MRTDAPEKNLHLTVKPLSTRVKHFNEERTVFFGNQYQTTGNGHPHRTRSLPHTTKTNMKMNQKSKHES